MDFGRLPRWTGRERPSSTHAITTISRNDSPPIAQALAELGRPAILDGEIVALDDRGHARFEWLVNRGKQQGTLVYYVFDLLMLDGKDLRQLPLGKRKQRLARLLAGHPHLLEVEHIEEEVRQRLPADLQPVVTFAYCTGWRGRSEILTRQWQHVDWEGGTIRLDAGEAKNDEPREFPFLMDEELTAVLKTEKARTEDLQKQHGIIIPWLFYRETQTGVSRIKDFRKAWETACGAAGIPGRLVHDFRRTAVRNLERAGVSRSVAMMLTGTRPKLFTGAMRSFQDPIFLKR
jgi:integrase